MQYARLGRTGLKVSRICLGTMTFGGQADEQQSGAIMDRAAELGVNFFDTADSYPFPNDGKGISMTEKIIGRWMQGKRQNFVIATKCWGRTGPNSFDAGNSRRHILDAVDASLRRLKTDWIDLYQLHRDDPEVPMEETLEAMDSLVKSGKVRYIGTSNWSAYRLALSLGRSDVKNVTRFVSAQPRYSLLFRQWERDLFPLALEEGLGVIVFSPTAGGFLTGKHQRAAAEAGSRFDIHEMSREMYWQDEKFEVLDAIKGIADELGMPMATLAVPWVLSNPAVTAPIVGASKPEQLDATACAADVTLPAEVLVRLDELTRKFRMGDAAM